YSASKRATTSGDEPAGKPTMMRALRPITLAWPDTGRPASPARKAAALDTAMKRRRPDIVLPSLRYAVLIDDCGVYDILKQVHRPDGQVFDQPWRHAEINPQQLALGIGPDIGAGKTG